MKKVNIFFIQIENCIYGNLAFNKADYNMFRTINNIHRKNNYTFSIDTLRPGVVEFIQFIKKKYNNPYIYVYSNYDHCWITDYVGPSIQKHFKVNKPYLTSSHFKNENLLIDDIIKDKKINNLFFIGTYECSIKYKKNQIIIPSYDNLQYINIRQNMINLFDKNIFDNEDFQNTFIKLMNRISFTRLSNYDPIILHLIEALNMRYIELNNKTDDEWEKLKNCIHLKKNTL